MSELIVAKFCSSVVFYSTAFPRSHTSRTKQKPYRHF